MATSLHARLDDLQRRWLVARQTSPRLVAIATVIVAGATVLMSTITVPGRAADSRISATSESAFRAVMGKSRIT